MAGGKSADELPAPPVGPDVPDQETAAVFGGSSDVFGSQEEVEVALDSAFIGETTAKEKYAAACEDIPTRRIERLLGAINSHLAKISRGLDYIDTAHTFEELTNSRLAEVIGALDALDRNASIVKTKSVAAELRRLRELIQEGESQKRAGVKGLLMSVRNAMASCRKAVEFVDRDDIRKIITVVRELGRLHADVHSVLVADLPAIAEDPAEGSLLDNENWAGLMVGLKRAQPAEKPVLIAMAMRRLTEDMDRTARQIVKLKARTTKNGATEAEAAVAARRQIALRASVSVLRRRLVALSAAFYRHRERQLLALAAATKTAVDATRHDAVETETMLAVKEFLHRHAAKRVLDDIRDQDVRLEAGKGMNPHMGFSMAALMRHYKDNYVERIATSGKADHA